MTAQETLEKYKHIELTEEETSEAILWAKIRKEEKIKKQEMENVAAENRRFLTEGRWPYKQTRDFMLWRAGQIFKDPKFQLDTHTEPVFELLCHYFSESPEFIPLAKQYGVKEPSLEKGIILQGVYGVGKTWMMDLFSRNQRQVFRQHNCKKIANDVRVLSEAEFIDKYLTKEKNAINDRSAFYHRYMGISLEDIGTEEIKNDYGNKKNTIAEIIEYWYILWVAEMNNPDKVGLLKPHLHGTTNLGRTALEEKYTERVTSRMREMFNFIVLGGNDRRK